MNTFERVEPAKRNTSQKVLLLRGWFKSWPLRDRLADGWLMFLLFCLLLKESELFSSEARRERQLAFADFDFRATHFHKKVMKVERFGWTSDILYYNMSPVNRNVQRPSIRKAVCRGEKPRRGR